MFSPLALTIALAAAPIHAGSDLRTAPAPSPLWGDLEPGPHPIGYRVLKLRDMTRSNRSVTDPSGPTGQGYPLVVNYWYPAVAPSGAARRMTFAGYQAPGLIDERLHDPTAARLAEGDADLKAFYERPFNFPFGAIEPDRWARLGPTPLLAVADLPPRSGRFPLVVGVGGAGGNHVMGEYLASHGYVVALVSSPANLDLAPGARMEWYVRDLEFALAKMRELPFVDGGRVGTWGFSFAGMPALLAAIRSPEIAAVLSLESALFSQPFTAQLVANPFYDPGNLRVPLLHMMRVAVSEGELAGFASLRYARRYRYQLNDTTLVHQDFGNHGMAAAVVLGKRPAAERAVRVAQKANAEYARHFLDAFVKRDAQAAAWLERSPEDNGNPAGAVLIDRQAPLTPAPSATDIEAWFEGPTSAAIDRLRAAIVADPLAPVFQERAINTLAYRLLQSRGAVAIDLFRLNVELHPQSANTYDSLAEAYETTGDRLRAVEAARKTIEAAQTEPGLPAATRETLERIARERIERLGGS